MFKKLGSFVFLFIALVNLGPSSILMAQSKPNIILINLDDADAEMFELPYSEALYPNMMAMAKEGVTFANFHVTTPLCGPSRACLYRGQYAHNTGVRVNQARHPNSNGFNGGFKYYRDQGYFNDDLSTWMKNAGYRTMMVGKFLHSDFQKYVPPGWDDFRSYLGGRYFGTYFFSNELDPNGKVSQKPLDQYRTHAEAEDALQLLEQHAALSVDQPFFLNINPLGPHRAQPSAPEMIEPRMLHWWPNIRQPFSAAFNEADVSDKGGFFGELPTFDEIVSEGLQTHYRERALATRSVDDLVGAIRAKVVELGIEDNTYIFLTSDNGFQLGHNRSYGKGVATDRVSRVPCFVIGPEVPVGFVSNHLIGHIDLAPTITRLAGGQVPEFVDGRSFAELLKPGGFERFPQFRVGLLIENFALLNIFGSTRHNGAATTVRFRSEIYTEWSNGDREYYDLRVDPEQLQNDYEGLDEGRRNLFSAWLRVLRNPDQLPLATFSNLYDEGLEVQVGGAVHGIAEDWDGVDVVRLAIRHQATGKFWNGTQWQESFVQNEVSLANRGGQLTEWEFNAMPPMDEHSEGTLSAWIWAYDSLGNYGSPSRVNFRLDSTPPITRFLNTEINRFDGRVVIQGETIDAVGGVETKLEFQNLSTLQYWSPDGYQSDSVSISLPVSNGRWRWEGEMPAGTFVVTATSIDGSNLSSEPTGFEFAVD